MIKHKFSLEDHQPIKLHNIDRFKQHKPSDFFKDKTSVSLALLESLSENDAQAFIEILDSYLRINNLQFSN